jgi:hypothetical protein
MFVGVHRYVVVNYNNNNNNNYNYYYYYYYFLLTEIELSPGGSSPTLVQTKIKIHKTTENCNNKTTTKHKKHKTRI